MVLINMCSDTFMGMRYIYYFFGTADFDWPEPWTHFIRNNGNWNFQVETLPGDLTSRYHFVVGDYDNDQDPDLLLSGERADKVLLLRNNLNPKPVKPGLAANMQTSIAGNVLALSWNAATDNESASLRYNVYVKRDGQYFISPYTDIALGTSGIPGFSNVGHNRMVSINMNTWPDGYYSWGVQTVDGENNVSGLMIIVARKLNRIERTFSTRKSSGNSSDRKFNSASMG